MKNWEKYSKQIAKNLAESKCSDDFINNCGCINNDHCETCPCGYKGENPEYFECHYTSKWLNEEGE